MRGGVVIEVALVVAGGGSEAVGALGVEGSEGGDAGESWRCCKALLSLAYLSSEAFCRIIPSHMQFSMSNRRVCGGSQAVHVCVQPG